MMGNRNKLQLLLLCDSPTQQWVLLHILTTNYSSPGVHSFAPRNFNNLRKRTPSQQSLWGSFWLVLVAA